MRHTALPLLAALAFTSGCGADVESAARTQIAPATTTATTAATTSAADRREDDERELRLLGDAWMDALRSSDFKAACETLSPRARARLRRKGGTCQNVLRSTQPKNPRKVLDRLQPNDVVVRGDRATIVIGEPGRAEVIDKYYGARIDGRWYLMIKRAARGSS